jgi:hypothetical protein
VNKYTAQKKSGMFIPALGGVTLSFKREIKPYKKYEIWTRVLSWDEKWIYMVSNFVEAGKAQPSAFTDQPWKGGSSKVPTQAGRPPIVYATAISKYVLKQGRRTISPETFLRDCKLLPPEEVPGAEKAWSTDVDVESSKVQVPGAGSQLNIPTEVEGLRAKGMAIATHMAGLEDAHACFTGGNEPIFASY